jgi:hypothetical protein
MAAGQGFKTFTTGEVLTAGDVNGYLMQGINVFTNSTARDAAITAPAEGQFAFTKDNNSLWYYDGAAWVASGATGDIEGVTAGVGISGGGTSGTVTVTNSMATALTTKGDIVVATGSGTFVRQGVGTNGQVLTADSTQADGVIWSTPSSGSLTQLATGSLTGSSVVVSSLSGAYKALKVIVTGYRASGNSLCLRINNDSTANRHLTVAFGIFPAAASFNNTFLYITDGGNSSSENALAIIDIYDYANTTTRKFVQIYSMVANNSDATQTKMAAGNGGYNQTSAVTGLTFLPDAGSFAGGTYFIYGVN